MVAKHRTLHTAANEERRMGGGFLDKDTNNLAK